MGLLGLVLLAAGELGHLTFEVWGAELAHHVFHLGFGVGAFVLFALYVIRDIRRHGPPAFSWRIRRP